MAVLHRHKSLWLVLLVASGLGVGQATPIRAQSGAAAAANLVSRFQPITADELNKAVRAAYADNVFNGVSPSKKIAILNEFTDTVKSIYLKQVDLTPRTTQGFFKKYGLNINVEDAEYLGTEFMILVQNKDNVWLQEVQKRKALKHPPATAH